MDSHGDKVSILVAHVSVVPVKINTFANRAHHDISTLCSSNKNPWGSLSQQHCHSHPHKNDSIHKPVYLLHHPNGNVICKNPAPLPFHALIHVFEKVYHLHRIGFTKPVFRVPVLTCMVTPDLQTQSHHLHMNIFSKLDILSSAFISTFLNGPSTVILNIIACSFFFLLLGLAIWGS